MMFWVALAETIIVSCNDRQHKPFLFLWRRNPRLNAVSMRKSSTHGGFSPKLYVLQASISARCLFITLTWIHFRY